MKDKFKKILVSAASVLFWVLLWHIAALIANTKLLFKIPLPLDTVKELSSSALEPIFWQAVGNSLWHIVSGFVLAVILGLIFGMLSGNSKIFYVMTSPLSRLIRSVPVAAFIILAWLWIPSTAIPSFISFLMVFPIVWVRVETALLSVDNRLIEMATVMGMQYKGIILNIKAT